jgi:histone acetyltransferase (RNA polymerase elongator complex component)
MIIPFFIPHSGCPHQCVFCNQQNITGQGKAAEVSSVPLKVNKYLKTAAKNDTVQIAFYGGSFTALPVETQRSYLGASRPFLDSGQVNSIRLSTRPDCITRDGLLLLREYRVDTVELGVQSMDDNVLSLSGRGHSAAATLNAVSLLREYKFIVGLQLMPGLPGDSAEGFMHTVDKAIALMPDLVRLYPALVINGTPLEKLYKSGRYSPLALDEALSLCKAALMRFEQAGIDVIRIGLQPTEELEKPGTILAGPYHPAFRQLVESAILLDRMKAQLAKRTAHCPDVTFLVHPRDLSSAIGQKRANIGCLKNEFALHAVTVRTDPSLSRRTVKLMKCGGV